MTMFFNQMLGCLIIAACIGGAVGWLLRNVLHTRLQESESAGGLVEWLDVQLAKRDEQHQIALHKVELQLAERDRRIHELEQCNMQLKMQAEDNEALPIDKAA